ncbi:hypothetical protein FACS1894172_00890 [Spirochaetia bacterium]|nr:hypothetical protein FACS1894164_17670 [Spirochaetia bacterium]GHU29538.1 hypothetical protein FACS1894172_00890 [Spirochaetia bacterium]
MDRHELLQKIATFPLIARNLAEDLLTGDFRSMFRGQGIEADEVRRYERGDDVRSIDWSVSARFGSPYVKMYREERDMVLSLVLDCSPSMRCGGVVSCYDQAILVAALIAFSAEQAGLRVGATFFARKINAVFLPRKGRAHLMSMINAAIQAEPTGNGSDLGFALTTVRQSLKRRSLIVVISDFQSVHWEAEMGDLCQKHEVLAIRISSPLGEALPEAGLLSIQDPETGIITYAPTHSAAFQKAWSQWHQDRSTSWYALTRRAGARSLNISTDDDAATYLIRFFKNRGPR